MTVTLFPHPAVLSLQDVVDVARSGTLVQIDDAALSIVSRSRASIDALASAPTPAYGVSTGFGALATKHIPPDQRRHLQRSLIRSHAAGAGEPVEVEVVRAMMLLRLRTLASGFTGIRPETLLTYAAALNAGVLPIVPEYGSLGCSGDLAPLAHTALMLMGEGDAIGRDGSVAPAAALLASEGIDPLVLEEKEGLALINGTDGMLGMLILAIADLHRLLPTADLAAALSVEALLGTDAVFAADLHLPLRPHPGQATSADNMRRLLQGSPIVASHREGDSRVQDAYSLRCAPQVAGAARDTITHAALIAERELAAVIDNPVVLPDGRVESNGNFHGAPVAYVLDFLAIVIADLASMSERRTDRMLDPARSHGLPPFLAHDPGVDSGHMIAQYTQAGIVSELKRLASPASVDSIPSSAMQEDHVSMGWSAGRKLRRAVDGLRKVLGIEVLTACRALDLRAPLTPGPAASAVVAALRTTVPGPGTDRYLAPEIAATVEAVADGRLLRARGSGHRRLAVTSRWWCELAWLGHGPDASSGVLLEVGDDRFTAVTPGAPSKGATVLTGLTLPGLVNSHSHAFHRALRGRTHGSGSFWSWRDQMYTVARSLDPDSYLALATAVYAEMALAGITTVGEFHYLHHGPEGVAYSDGDPMGEAIIQAAEAAGLRLTLLDVCYLSGGIASPLDPVQRRFSDGTAERWATRIDRLHSSATVRIGAAIHSVRTVPPDDMTVVSEWAARNGPLHAHLSEQPDENRSCLEAYGRTPTELLESLGILRSGFTAVHATHVTGHDIELLGSAGCRICMCPTTERELADGIGPASRLRAAGAGICLGSDSHAVINLFEEARAVELDERLSTGRRGHHSPSDLLLDASAGGAASLGWPECGRIEPGALADFTTIRTDAPSMAGTLDRNGHGAASATVFCASAADVTNVVVGGRQIVSDGQHLMVDEVGQTLSRAIRRVLAG